MLCSYGGNCPSKKCSGAYTRKAPGRAAGLRAQEMLLELVAQQIALKGGDLRLRHDIHEVVQIQQLLSVKPRTKSSCMR